MASSLAQRCIVLGKKRRHANQASANAQIMIAALREEQTKRVQKDHRLFKQPCASFSEVHMFTSLRTGFKRPTAPPMAFSCHDSPLHPPTSSCKTTGAARLPRAGQRQKPNLGVSDSLPLRPTHALLRTALKKKAQVNTKIFTNRIRRALLHSLRAHNSRERDAKQHPTPPRMLLLILPAVRHPETTAGTMYGYKTSPITWFYTQSYRRSYRVRQEHDGPATQGFGPGSGFWRRGGAGAKSLYASRQPSCRCCLNC